MENQEKKSSVVIHQTDALLRKFEKILDISEGSLTVERLDKIISLKEKFSVEKESKK